MPAKSSRQYLQKLALTHGLSIAVFSSLCTLAALFLSSWVGVLVGFLVALCGVMEFYGGKLVGVNPLLSQRYLTGAQGLLFAVLVCYCLWAWQHTDVYVLLNNEEVRAQLYPKLHATGMTYGEFALLLERVVPLFYLLVVLVSFVYQGTLGWIYWRRTARIIKEETPPELPTV